MAEGGQTNGGPGAGQSAADAGEARDAFVSHASHDRPTAEALTAYLESHGLRCWVAPRDVLPGTLYADAIVRAINEARALVLVLSASSVASSHVGKELERASAKKRPIIALKIDAAPLTPAFEYFLSESQWIDLDAGGQAAAFGKLADALHRLRRPGAAATPAASAVVQRPPPARRPAAVVLAVAGIALAVAGYFAWHAWRHPAGPEAAQAEAATDKSIAVLPFDDMSEAKDQGYFADGMAEQILDLLAKVPSLKVIARTSSFQFKGKAEDVRAIGDKLGVATVLEGSVRKAGNRLRITTQLIRASDGSHLWSETYDRTVDDVFHTQDEIAAAVVSALRVSLLGGASPKATVTTSTEAYTLYLQGLAVWQRYTADDTARARELLERALKLDPKFAPAWAALSGTYGDSMVFGLGSETRAAVVAHMRETAERALALDPTLANVHAAMSTLAFAEFDLRTSEAELRKALELEPGNLPALSSGIYNAIAFGRLDDAVRFGRRAIELDPLNVDNYRGLATALYFGGHLDEAEAEYRKALELNPDAEGFRYRLALILLAEGKPDAALAEVDREHNDHWRRIGRVMALDALGRRAESDVELAALQKTVNGWDYQVAQIYALRHQREQAFAWLDKAYQLRDPGFANYLKSDPILADLRSDARYRALLAKLNLPD